MRFLPHRASAAAACAVALTVTPVLADTLARGTPANLFTVAPYVSGLSQPTSFTFLPDGRMLITDKGGELLIADTGGNTISAGTFTVDTASEKGLLNVILHPNFANNRLLILYYSANNSIGGTDVDRHRVVTVPLGTNDRLDMTQETILVRGLRGPANHDGGAIAIGPDGKLYVGDGDTGCNSGLAAEPAYTPRNFFATCLTNPNGKILRVNLDGTIPSDNPLYNAPQVTACGSTCGTDVTGLAPATGTTIRKDVWAWGFRNPWRFWFDPQTGNLWVGDVGEVTYEEIDVIPPNGGGKHYGWPWREGKKGNPPSSCQAIVPNKGDCVDPQYYCFHGGLTPPAPVDLDGGCFAIIGGVIADSCDWPTTFKGHYFFGDHRYKWIGALPVTSDRSGPGDARRTAFITTTGGPTHIGTGPDGALYYSTIQPGTIQRVAPKTPIACPDAGAGGATGGGGAGSGGAANAGAATTSGGAENTGGAATQGGSPNAGGTTTGNAGVAVGATPGTINKDAASDGSLGIAGAGDTSSCGCRLGSDASRDRAAILVLATGAALFSRRRRRARPI